MQARGDKSSTDERSAEANKPDVLIATASSDEEDEASGVAGSQGGRDGTGWKRRYTTVLLCFLAAVVCNVDRVNMSIAILPIAQTFHLTRFTQGLVQSSFFWGYITTQILGGMWADKYGAKRVLGFAVVWWSLATMTTPLAARMGLPSLLAARACMGVGEGVALPAINNMLSKWVPMRERSRSLAVVYSGMYAGSVIGLAISPPLIDAFGWPSVFYIFGGIGLLWYVWWDRLAASSPAEDPHITQRELRYIGRHVTQQRPTAIPWMLLLSKRPVWALIIAHFCHNWAGFILLTYMPTYFNQELRLDLRSSGFLSVLPWVAMAASANASGWAADILVERGARVTSVRKAMQTVGFLGPALFLAQLGGVRTAAGAVWCMVAAQGLMACSKAGLFSNHQDIGPRYAGVLLGLSNTAGCLAGMMGTAATGYILEQGSWGDVWRVAVGLLLAGSVAWNALATGDRVFD